MEKDVDLEILSAKRLLELKKKLALQQQKEMQQKKEKEEEGENSRGLVVGRLVDRGLEVLETAERLNPEISKIVVEKLAELFRKRVVEGYVSGGELLMLFKRLGVNVRVETRIAIEEDGKLISIADKLRRLSEER